MRCEDGGDIMDQQHAAFATNRSRPRSSSHHSCESDANAGVGEAWIVLTHRWLTNSRCAPIPDATSMSRPVK